MIKQIVKYFFVIVFLLEGTRNGGRHIALFFVDGAHHRKRIGRSLFNAALENCSGNEMTVNSSPYAGDIYRHLGFEAIGEDQTVTGIRFTPMSYRRKTATLPQAPIYTGKVELN